MVYCKECGTQNGRGKHCRNCGAHLLHSYSLRGILAVACIVVLLLLIAEYLTMRTPIEDPSFLGDVKRAQYLFLGKEFCGNNKCIADELYQCRADCAWCGDNTCQAEEIGNCFDDCEWCGDGFCRVGESCDSCVTDCGRCKAAAYCGDGTCNPGECYAGCRDCSAAQCANGVCEKEKGENCVTSPADCACNRNERCDKQRQICETVSCGDGRCEGTETGVSCPNDCKDAYHAIGIDPLSDLPIIFVHGHSPEENDRIYGPLAWKSFQQRLASEGYEDMGLILPRDYPPRLTKGVWGGKKISVSTTYYLSKYDEIGNKVGPDDNQPISTYAQRLCDVIEVVKHNTGKDKVIIVAHSMGGLVSRSCIKSYGGEKSVAKLVVVGTPNHGTYGTADDFCDVFLPFGFHNRNPDTPECKDMRPGSDFLRNLNSGDETPGQIEYLAIIGRNERVTNCPGEKYSDNVICADSVYLQGAENIYYDDFAAEYSLSNSLHSAMIDPVKAPDVYVTIVKFIRK